MTANNVVNKYVTMLHTAHVTMLHTALRMFSQRHCHRESGSTCTFASVCLSTKKFATNLKQAILFVSLKWQNDKGELNYLLLKLTLECKII